MARLLSVAVISGAALVTVGAQPSSATITNITPVTVWSLNPDAMPPPPATVLASLTFTAHASWKYYITGKLVFDNATTSILVNPRIDCDGTTLHPLSYSSTNVLPADPSRTIYARALWDPPAGNPTCVLSIYPHTNADHSDTNEHFDVQSGSYLEVTTVSNDSGTAYDPGTGSPLENTLLTSGNAYDAAVLTYTAPSTATSIHTVSDINVTSCVPMDGTPGCSGGVSGVSSTFTYTHVVYQYKTDIPADGYCATTSTTATSVTIAWATWHHYKVPSENIVPVLGAGCVKKFRIKTYVKSISGNPIVVQRGTTPYSGDHGPYSNSIAIPT
jgi:hypothetical protein